LIEWSILEDGKHFTSADLNSTFRERLNSTRRFRARMGGFARQAHYKEKAGFDQEKSHKKIMAARI
jgi:hypothetical protein